MYIFVYLPRKIHGKDASACAWLQIIERSVLNQSQLGLVNTLMMETQFSSLGFNCSCMYYPCQ